MTGKNKTTATRLRDIRDCPQCMKRVDDKLLAAVAETAREYGHTTQAMLTKYLREYHKEGHRE